MSAPPPANERERLDALRSLDILDSLPEDEYQDLVRLAAAICGTPMAAISLVDESRQWFKARVGLRAPETSRDVAFCAHTILDDEPLVVDDALADPRFRENPLVVGDPSIRFYAGVPLTDPRGYNLGALCVIDREARSLTPAQRDALTILGRQVVSLIVARKRNQLLEDARVDARNAQERFLAFMNAGPMLAFMKDDQGRYRFVNEAILKRFGAEMSDWVGHTDRELFPDYADAVRAQDRAVLAGNQVMMTEETGLPDASGQPTYWQSYKFPVTDPRGMRLVAGVALDVTERKRGELALKEYEKRLLEKQAELEAANEQLRVLSMTDGLTRALNWAAFHERLHGEIERAHRYERPLSLVMLDIDNFKSFNDAYGHPAGDEVIRGVADILKKAVRASDVVARVGGEELAIILPETPSTGAIDVAERIRAEIAKSDWPHRPITVSIGVATRSASSLDAKSLVDASDAALYDAKHGGRNRVSVAPSSGPAPSSRRGTPLSTRS